MYLLSVAAIILCFVLVQCFQPSMGIGIYQFFDVMSILFLVGLIIPIMVSAGLLKDLNHAFRLVFGKKKTVTLLAMKRAKLAVDTMIKTALYGGVFVMLLQVVVLLHNMSDPAHIGPVISMALLTVLYAMIICLLMLPVRVKLEQKILEYIPSCQEEKEGETEQENA